jgi:surfeit locus 1 family protein
VIFFHPLRGPTIVTVLMLPILIGLGIWQVQRLHWKEGLLAAIDRNAHAQPVSLNEHPRIEQDPQTLYLRVAVRGHFLNAKESYLFASDTEGDAGYHVVTPLVTNDGRTYLIDRGYVPKEKLDPATRPQGEIGGETKIVGTLRWEDRAGWFTPPSDSAHRIWYSRNVDGIAKADHVRLALPAIIDADATPNPGSWPKGGQTIIDIPNNHLSYALTWFGLALVLMGVYLAYHWTHGRLGIRR